MFGRKKVAALVAEFLGTGVLTLAIMSVQRSQVGLAYFVSIIAGVAVASLSVVFADASGAHFNPAVTIGSWAVGRIRAAHALSYVVVQLLGGWFAYGLFTYFVNTSLPTVGGSFTWRLFVAEAVGTFIFAFVWAAVAIKNLAVSVLGIGFTVAMLIASVATGVGVANPAVALGDRAWVVGDFTHWIGWGAYAAAPVVGGIVGFVLYQAVFNGGWSLRLMGVNSARVATPSTTRVAAKPAARTKKKPATRKR